MHNRHNLVEMDKVQINQVRHEVVRWKLKGRRLPGGKLLPLYIDQIVNENTVVRMHIDRLDRPKFRSSGMRFERFITGIKLLEYHDGFDQCDITGISKMSGAFLIKLEHSEAIC